MGLEAKILKSYVIFPLIFSQFHNFLILIFNNLKMFGLVPVLQRNALALGFIPESVKSFMAHPAGPFTSKFNTHFDLID